MVKRKLSMSNSPLGRPERPIHVLAGQIQDYVHFPNPDPLYVVLGTLAGNILKGNPIWTVLVGAPASGKTLLLDMLYVDRKHRLKNLHSVDMIKSVSALLSGVSSKDVKKGATGGLLKQIGDNGILIVKDFTSMMSQSRDQLIEVVGAMRRIYDGSWDRPIGTDGGRVLYWSGKIGLLSACTGVIDRHHQILAELGERWIYYRLDKGDGYGETLSMLKNTDPKQSMYEMHDLIEEFLDNMGVSWDGGGIERRELDDLESNRIFSLAALSAHARSSVGRDWRTKEVTDVAETEKPTRLASALSQLYLGMELIGLGEDERWRVIGRVATDSVPTIRSMLIKESMSGAIKVEDMFKKLGCGTSTIRWACEDLGLHGVFEQVQKGDRFGDRARSWRLTQWARKHIGIGLKIRPSVNNK